MSEQTGIDEDDALAAEYALGVLGDDDRVAAQARIGADPAFAANVRRWSFLLAEFLLDTDEIPAPARLKQRLMERLHGKPASKREGSGSLVFWQIAAACATAIAVVALLFAAVVTSQMFRSPGYTMVATLAPPEAPLTLSMRINPETGVIEILDAALQDAVKQADQTTELWLIPEDGTPRSLGVIRSAGASRILIPAELRPLFNAGAVLAVSLEPSGGSPSGAPTGPVIALGSIRLFSGD